MTYFREPPGPTSDRMDRAPSTLEGPAGPGQGWSATLAVTEEQALTLIGAQSGGREIRLLSRT